MKKIFSSLASPSFPALAKIHKKDYITFSRFLNQHIWKNPSLAVCCYLNLLTSEVNWNVTITSGWRPWLKNAARLSSSIIAWKIQWRQVSTQNGGWIRRKMAAEIHFPSRILLNYKLVYLSWLINWP